MVERGPKINPEEAMSPEALMSLDGEYNFMMNFAAGMMGELLNDYTSLSKKGFRRLKELDDRMKSIQAGWRNTLGLPKPERKKEMREVMYMLRELVDDMKKFETKKLSI